MKTSLLRSVCSVVCLTALSACGGSSSGTSSNVEVSLGTDDPETSSDLALSWTIDQFSYTGSSIASLQTSSEDFIITVSSTTGSALGSLGRLIRELGLNTVKLG